MKLEIGGGNKNRNGWYNLDLYAKNPDYRVDLRTHPYLPIQDNNWWDEYKLETFLRASGFSNVRASRPYQSRDAELRGEEFDSHLKISMYMECERS